MGREERITNFASSFFPTETEHVHPINGILLDNAYVCSSVVFGSTESFPRTLEWYLTAPCTIGKIVTGGDADLRLKLPKEPGTVSKSLGSEKKPVWREESVPVVQDYEKFRLRIIEQRRLLTKIIKKDTRQKYVKCRLPSPCSILLV
jgi:hypothetical protein